MRKVLRMLRPQPGPERMNTWRIMAACAAAGCALTLLMLWLAPGALPVRAEALPQIPTPPSHLGYGINVRSQDVITPLFAPLGFEWLKLWEEYGTFPTTRYTYSVLFLIDCTQRSADLTAWGNAVQDIAERGRGLIEAYEICNEPNRRGWLTPDVPPDPALYVQMLRVAYERIRAADPAAIVVSAGLAPVGRIEGDCNGWSGNDCSAMDEREYARQEFLLGARSSFDAFGYHPYGFAYEPETDPYSVSNGFAFRGAEVMHDLMAQYSLGDKPIWATEFNWLRHWEGTMPENCRAQYEAAFGWMELSEEQQGNYLTRAFQYADENWPWMGVMFVWNLDWHNYHTWDCEAARFFSVRKDNGTALGVPALAYTALISMEKRPGFFGPRLAVKPTWLTFLADADEPGVFTGVIVPLNMGYRVLTWTATAAPGLQVTPTLALTTGVQGAALTVTVDSAGYPTGTFTGSITVTATATDVLDSPLVVSVTLRVVPEIYRFYLPLAMR